MSIASPPGVGEMYHDEPFERSLLPAPQQLRGPRAPRPQGRLTRQAETVRPEFGAADASNPEYVTWLRSRSMLHDAHAMSRQFAAQASMWQNPYANPDPRAAVRTASVWFHAYPLSLVTEPGTSFLATLADERLWRAFRQVGIEGLHTGPVKCAGGLDGWEATPSVDGHFDRISTAIDPLFGTENEYRAVCEIAGRFGGIVIDDIVPGHTGKGPDFRLAEMNDGDYPGIYHMVQIPLEYWPMLPDVPPGRDSVNLDEATEEKLEREGFIIGRLQRVIFYDKGIKETNWSATAPVLGVDGVYRRWVYLHYFKEGQPTINWLDPTFAGMRLVIGDALHALADLGAGGLRLDANGFLGVERGADDSPGWSEGHPLSEAANHVIAGMVRKLGGFTFQELNLSIDDIRGTSGVGPDLSYDFINRPAYHHALLTQRTEFLRLTLNCGLDLGVDPASLVHGLQNHDELTYELIHFRSRHADDTFAYDNREMSGLALAEEIQADLTDALVAKSDYNLVFTTNGIACTTVSVVSAALGLHRGHELSAIDVEHIRRGHLLMAMFNALQPGVLALSGWDITGMLTLDPAEVADLVATGDTRWINRGAHDILGAMGATTPSLAGMPRGRSLYGGMQEQLNDPMSFARRLSHILDVRRQHAIATSRQLAVPVTSDEGVLVMVHELEAGRGIQLTVLNFAQRHAEARIDSPHLSPGTVMIDALTGAVAGTVDADRSLSLTMTPHQGMCVVAEPV